MSKKVLTAVASIAAVASAENYYLQVATFAGPEITRTNADCAAVATNPSGIIKSYVGGKYAWLTVATTTPIPTTDAEVVAKFKTRNAKCAAALGADAVYIVRLDLPTEGSTEQNPVNTCINQNECGHASACLCQAGESCYVGGGDSACEDEMKCPQDANFTCVNTYPLTYSFPNPKWNAPDATDADLQAVVQEVLSGACINNKWKTARKDGDLAHVIRFAGTTVHPSCLTAIKTALQSNTAVDSARCKDRCGYEECPCVKDGECFFKNGLCGDGDGIVCNSVGDWDGKCEEKKQFFHLTGELKNWWMYDDIKREFEKSIFKEQCAGQLIQVIKTGNVGQVSILIAGTAKETCVPELLKDNAIIKHYFQDSTVQLKSHEMALATTCTDTTTNQIQCVAQNAACAEFLCSEGTQCATNAECASGKCEKSVCLKNNTTIHGLAVAAAAVIAAFLF